MACRWLSYVIDYHCPHFDKNERGANVNVILSGIFTFQ